MNRIFVSLVENAPEGFKKTNLESIDPAFDSVCFFAGTSVDPEDILRSVQKETRGIIVTGGSSFSLTKKKTFLWHLTCPVNMYPFIREVASCFLDIICSCDADKNLETCLENPDETEAMPEKFPRAVYSLQSESIMPGQTEKAVMESDEKYRSIFNATNEAIFIHDARTGKIIDVNDRVLELFGYTYDEAMKCTIGDYSLNESPYTFEEARLHLIKAIEEGPQVFCWQSRRKNGSIFHSEVSLRKARIGRKIFVIAVVRDITGRKLAEAAMIASEQIFRAYFELNLVGMVIISSERKLSHFNDRFCEILGCKREELEMAAWLDLVKQHDIDDREAKLQMVFSGESEGYIVDRKIRKKDGSIGYLNISVRGLKNRDGKTETCLAVFQDITERKKAEKALRKSEALLFSTVESLPFDIFAMDENRKYILQNSASRQKWGNVLGKTPDETNASPENLSLWQKNNSRAFAGEQVTGEETYTLNGRKIHYYRIITPIYPDDPQKGIVGVNIDISERIKIEEALKENEERLRTLINAMPDIICFKDDNGRWLEANGFYLRLFGLEGVDYRGRKNSELAEFTSFNRDAFVARDDSDEEAWKAGVPARCDEVVEKQDGSSLIFDTIKIPMFYPDGRRKGLIKVGRDITERKRIENELVRSQRNFETLFESMKDMILILDPEGRIIHVNDSVTDRLGYSQDQIKDERFDFILNPWDLIKYEISLESIIQGKADCSTIALISEKGEPVDVENTMIYGEWDKKPAIIWISRDISELRLSEKKFSTAFNSNSAVMAISTVNEGRYLDVNSSFIRLSGYTREEIVGKSSMDLGIFNNPEDREKIKQIFLKNGCVRDFESKLRAKDGSILHGILAMDRFTLGNEPCWLTVMTDLTELRKAEAEKLEMERRLLHAQKLESLGVLAGGIAHDFNNLLTGILGNLDLALLSIPSGSLAGTRIEQAIQASYRAEELTRQMLAYSGKGRFEIRPVNISRIVRENAELFRASITRTVTLDLAIQDDLPFIEADPGQIQQVIMNLITNAAEATGLNPGVINLRTDVMECSSRYLASSRLDEKPEPGIFAYIEVTDNGCGMDEETVSRIFEPFFTTKFTGRGLGMAAVLGIIRSHKGAILIDSKPGNGSTFRVLFPVPGELNGSAVKNTSGAGISDSAKPGHNVTVLVVDDEDPVRELCVDFLRIFGFRTLSASNGKEAVEIFRNHSDEIACVILDLTMPGLDGAGTFRELRRIRPDSRVILSSGYSEYEATAIFANQGLAGFIQKPYRIAVLQEKIQTVLNS